MTAEIEADAAKYARAAELWAAMAEERAAELEELALVASADASAAEARAMAAEARAMARAMAAWSAVVAMRAATETSKEVAKGLVLEAHEEKEFQEMLKMRDSVRGVGAGDEEDP